MVMPLPVINLAESWRFYDYEAKHKRNDVEYGRPSGFLEDEEKHLKELPALFQVVASGWGVLMPCDEQGNFGC